MKRVDNLILAARIFDAVYQMTLLQEKDNNPDHWKTINGAHVHVDENGDYDGGAGGLFNGKHHYGKGYKEKAEKDRQKNLKESIKEKRSWKEPVAAKVKSGSLTKENFFEEQKKDWDLARERSDKREIQNELEENWKNLYKEEMTTENLVKRVNEKYEKEWKPLRNPWAEEQRQRVKFEAQEYNRKMAEKSQKAAEEARKKNEEYRNSKEGKQAERRRIAAEIEEARMKMLKKRVKRDNPKITKKELESRTKEEYARMYPGGVTQEEIDWRLEEMARSPF